MDPTPAHTTMIADHAGPPRAGTPGPARPAATPQASAQPVLVIRWSIDGRAAVAAGLATAGSAAERDGMALEIELVRLGESLRAHAVLASGRERRPLALEAAGDGALVVDGVLTHADVPGVVRATWTRDAQGRAVVRYARTDVLSRLGLPGGRYELAGAAG